MDRENTLRDLMQERATIEDATEEVLCSGVHALDSNLATALCQHFERFFTFLDQESVEPTNNAVKRALRCAVQWRKTSFESRSARRDEVAVAR